MHFTANKKLKFIVTMFFIVVFSVSFTTFAYALNGTPSSISYHGTLTDTGGNPLGGTGTSYYFKFSFWDSPTGGSKVWPSSSPTSLPLTVKQGSFNVNIGDTDNGYPDTLDYNWNSNQKVYLQIEISSDNNTFETLSPRSLVTSAPFSQVSSQVNGVNDSSFGTTTPFLDTLVSMLSTATNRAVMTIKGAVGQVANLFNIKDSNDNTLFTVTPGGNVGVGTSTPGTKLEVNGIINTTNALGNITGDINAGSAGMYSWRSASRYIRFNTSGGANDLMSAGATMVINYSGAQNVEFFGSSAATAYINGNLSLGGGAFGGTNATTRALTIVSGTSQSTNKLFDITDNLGTNHYLYVAGTGNIGIGTSAPTTKLQVTDTNTIWIDPSTRTIKSSTGDLYISANGQNLWRGLDGWTGVWSDSAITTFFQTGRSGGNTTFSSVNGSSYGRLSFQVDNSGSNGIVFGTGNTALPNGYFEIRQAATTSLVVARGTGNVGIGTNAPTSLLHIKSATNAHSNLIIDNTTSNYNSALNFALAGSQKWAIGMNKATADGLDFWDSVNSVARMVIKPSGNIGIGTSAPAQLLHLSTATSTDQIYLQNTTASTGAGDNWNSPILKLSSNMWNSSSGGRVQSGKIQLVGSGQGNPPQKRLAFSIGEDAGTMTEALSINQLGNVGIGTNSPASLLTVNGNALIGSDIKPYTPDYKLQIKGTTHGLVSVTNLPGDSTTGLALSVGASGEQYVRTNFYSNGFIGFGPGNATRDVFVGRTAANTFGVFGAYDGSGIGNFTVSGNVGIGTTTPSAQLTTTGTVRFSSLTGAGSNLIVDSLGNVTVSSDERLKNIDSTFNRGLEDIVKINPITYHWKTETGYDTTNAYTGFSAQNMLLAIPEAVATSTDGFLNLADRPVIAALVNAVKELNAKIDKILAWFKNDKFNVQGDVCVDDVCVTKEQFKNLLNTAGGSVVTENPIIQISDEDDSSNSESASSTTETVPVDIVEVSASSSDSESISEATEPVFVENDTTEGVSNLLQPIEEPALSTETVSSPATPATTESE